MTSSPPAKRFDWTNLGLRALSAAILAPLALVCVWFGGWAFLILMAVSVALLTIEWGEMCDKETPIRAAAVISAAILIGVFATYLGHPWIGWLLVGLGAVAGMLIALARGKNRPSGGYRFRGASTSAPRPWRSPGSATGSRGGGWTLMLIAVVWAGRHWGVSGRELAEGPEALAALLAQ